MVYATTKLMGIAIANWKSINFYKIFRLWFTS